MAIIPFRFYLYQKLQPCIFNLLQMATNKQIFDQTMLRGLTFWGKLNNEWFLSIIIITIMRYLPFLVWFIYATPYKAFHGHVLFKTDCIALFGSNLRKAKPLNNWVFAYIIKACWDVFVLTMAIDYLSNDNNKCTVKSQRSSNLSNLISSAVDFCKTKLFSTGFLLFFVGGFFLREGTGSGVFN